MAADDRDLLPAISTLARRAGDAILSVYGQQFEVTNKADESPLTPEERRARGGLTNRQVTLS